MSRQERLANAHIELGVETSMGPRIVWLGRPGEESVLASTPDVRLSTGDGRSFSLVGGHRLWAAPEVPAATYVPDDAPVVVEPIDGGIRCIQPAPPETGVEKTIDIQLVEGTPGAVMTHHLRNTGTAPIRVAPWAITMLRAGGRAILPIGGDETHAHAFQAERSIVLWPYTQMDDALLRFGTGYVEVIANRDGPTKVGTALRRGWIAYLLDSVVFVKRAAHRDDALYTDLGASGQVYCNDRFCELETLGPLQTLHPGDVTIHTERWELRERAALPDTIEDLLTALDRPIG